MHSINLETIKVPLIYVTHFAHPRDVLNALARGFHVVFRYATLLHWPAAIYEAAHTVVLQHAENPNRDEVGFDKAWTIFVATCHGRWNIYIGFCTAYNAVTIGLLSAFPGIVDMGVISGIVCVFTSMVCSAVAVLLRAHLQTYAEPARGIEWLSCTSQRDASRWTSITSLFAVPDAWFIWSSLTFFVFFVAFCWERLGQGNGSTPASSDSHFMIIAAASLSVLSVSGILHILWILWALHIVGKQHGAASLLRPESRRGAGP